MSSPESTPRAEPSSVSRLLVLGLIAAAAGFSLFVVAQKFWIDDSFISFRYARNLVQGHGLVFNVGEPVEGYTNFLWMLVGALGLSLGFEAIHFVQGVSLLAQAGTLWLLYQIGRAAGHRGLLPVLAPLFLAGSIAFLAYPMTGMETSFFTLLVTAAFLLVQREQYRTRRGAIALGLVFLGLALTRFDGFVPVILLVSYPLLFGGPLFGNSRVARRGLLLPLGVFVAGLALYNLWRFSYYPTLLPNTFHAKTHFTLERFFGAGLTHVGGFARGWGVLPLLLALLPFVLRRATPTARYLGWVVLGQVGYVAVVGGDWMPYYRFLLPVLPLFYALMQEGWVVVADSVAERVPSPRFSGVVIVALLWGLHVEPVRTGLDFKDEVAPFFDPHDARRIGEFLAENLPEEALIGVEWGGIIPFYTQHRTLDTWGLTVGSVATGDFPRTIWGTRLGPEWLARQAPDLIAGNARIMPSQKSAMWSVTPQGNNNYSYYPSMATPEFGYEWKVFQLAEDAWWPALVRRDARPAGPGSDQ